MVPGPLNVVVAGNKAVLVTADGRLQVGTQGEPQPAGVALARMAKGDARRVREALRAAGFVREAAMPRQEKQ